MTKNEISRAIKDPILRQGFEFICRNLAELEIYNKELLQKNAELKKNVDREDNIIEALKRQIVEMDLYSDKAIEILKEFMRISKASDEDFEHDYSELIAEAEQFLSEVEE